MADCSDYPTTRSCRNHAGSPGQATTQCVSLSLSVLNDTWKIVKILNKQSKQHKLRDSKQPVRSKSTMTCRLKFTNWNFIMGELVLPRELTICANTVESLLQMNQSHQRGKLGVPLEMSEKLSMPISLSLWHSLLTKYQL